jgi:hypothetical protein
MLLAAAGTRPPSPFIVAGTTVLFASAAVVLVAPIKPFNAAEGWCWRMERYGRFGAYAGAFSAYFGVFLELGSHELVLAAVMLVPAMLALLGILISAVVLCLRVRHKQRGGDDEPESHEADDKGPAVGGDKTHRQGARDPENSDVDGQVPEPPVQAGKPRGWRLSVSWRHD